MKIVLNHGIRWAARIKTEMPVPHERSGIAVAARGARRRIGAIAILTLVPFFLPASVAKSAAPSPSPSARDVPRSLMQGAQCMADIVRMVPGVSDVQVTVSPAGSGGAYPVLEFRSVDASGRRRFTELSLFEISGANDAFVFDRSDIENDPVANRLLPEWKRKCQAGVGVITSEPGL
jgi:hypothetical protein